eukprot:CAMPEP_0118925800 /NCGR_PEP_ID=MMETSP1169-20130426/3624_1 /TAXON_ID=36882 /ORGANISM="Pyramimonas obovata, Strain CCMP722" /LENGTH=307 /DNA_ID=CAMNT_0006867195 /DNA_START=113 /DNA_END=1033 /DNA_ORIENTATION=-
MEGYEKAEFLGAGTFGHIYKVKSKSNGQHYVIKRVALGSNKEEERREAYREVQVLSALRHPHIVPYVEYFWEDEEWDCNLCLVMAHCEGGDLCADIGRRRKENKPFTEEEVWTYFVQILLALQYVHSKRILHRDIKVHNVFISQGRAMLGDFGVAKCLEESTDMAKSQVGTLSYLAPEVLEGQPYTYTSDIWALGCLFYEMCALDRLYRGSNPAHLILTVLDGEIPQLPPRWSDELRQVLGLMLRKRPMERVTATELIQHPLVMQRVERYLRQLEQDCPLGWDSWRNHLPPGTSAVKEDAGALDMLV